MAFKVFKAHNWRNANENRKLPPAPACCFHGFVSDPIIQFPPGNWLILVKSSRKRPYSEKIPLNTNESCFSAIYWGKLQDTATITNLNQASLDWSTHTFTLISRDVLERSFEFIQISLLQRYQTSSLSLRRSAVKLKASSNLIDFMIFFMVKVSRLSQTQSMPSRAIPIFHYKKPHNPRPLGPPRPMLGPPRIRPSAAGSPHNGPSDVTKSPWPEKAGTPNITETWNMDHL